MRALSAVCFLLLALSSVRCSASQVEVRALDTWRLEVRWNASGASRTHEVQVARTSLFQVVFQGNVSARAPLSMWVWKSELPLQCADNSVRVRSVFNSTAVSAWSQWATNHGQQNVPSTKARLFPMQEVLQEGTSAHFCCIPPAGAQVTEIWFSNRTYEMTPVDEHVRAIEVPSLEFKELGVTFFCRDSADSGKTVLNYVTFPPEKPQDLSCTTRDLKIITCEWRRGRQLDVAHPLRRCQYSLRVQDSGEVQCAEESCEFAALPGRGFYNISVVVRNGLGEESQSYAFNISHRVFPVPQYVLVSPGATDVEVSWDLKGNFTGLHFICQITLEPTGKTTEWQFFVSDPEQRLRATVQPLQPSSQYSTRVRCALQGNDWGSWSPTDTFSTEPLVTLDIWTSIRDQVHDRSLIVLWKTFNSGSDSNIEAFEVCVVQDSTRSSACVKVTEMKVNFTVAFGQCNVSVRAVTLRGSSITSYMSVQPEPMLKEKRIVGNSEGFLLSWSTLSSATCGYAVEWYMTGNAVACDLRWRKVSANQTSLSLSAEGFRKGHRYTFKIFSCQTEGHRLYEKRTGYLEEQEPLSAPKLLYPPSIFWSSLLLQWSFDEEDSKHPGFITGYRLTIQEHAGWTYRFWNISVEDPHSKSVPVKEDQHYTVRLAACTRAGCGPESVHTITTPQNHYLLMAKVMTPLLILIGCCFCLWPCKETLKGIAVDIFSFPSDQRMKVLELDDSLFEVSEMLRVLQVEDCKCCNLDSVDLRSSMEEKSWLIFTEERCKPAGPSLSEEELAWDELAAERVTGMTNLTYLSSLPPRTASPALESSRSHSAKYVASFNTNDYVTSFNTTEYITAVSPGDYVTSIKSGDYVTSFNTGKYVTSIKSSDYVTSFNTTEYITPVSPGDYVTSIKSGDYVTSFNTGDYFSSVSPGNHVTSASTVTM
ncbi:leukemia inhibitory factor receptor [Colossoma macropomum]|uniref:leukemia inhibitory factor receptor n=1 Tax=Colossoma macropomum TaxID=42526 RepID=UPI0018643E86|nr:leukemia inhibitory factor receptor [Colossoma macropomum]